MIEWLSAYVESLGYIAIVHPSCFVVRKQEGNNYFDVDFHTVYPGVRLDNIAQLEAKMCVDRCINCIVQMMSMAHSREQDSNE